MLLTKTCVPTWEKKNVSKTNSKLLTIDVLLLHIECVCVWKHSRRTRLCQLPWDPITSVPNSKRIADSAREYDADTNESGRSARIRAEAVTDTSRTLWHHARQFSGSKKGERPKPNGSHRSCGRHPHCWTRRRLGLVVFFQFSGRGQRIQQQDLEGRLCGLHALVAKPSLVMRSGLMRISWPQTPATPWAGCRTARAWGKDCVSTEHPRAAGPGYLRALARSARRSLQKGVPSRWRTGYMVSRAQETAGPIPLIAKER